MKPLVIDIPTPELDLLVAGSPTSHESATVDSDGTPWLDGAIDVLRQGIVAIGAEVLTHKSANRLQVSIGPHDCAARVDLSDGLSQVSRFDFAHLGPLLMTAFGRADDDAAAGAAGGGGGGGGDRRSPITCPVDAPPSDWDRVVRLSLAAHPPTGLRVDQLCFVHSPDGWWEWSIRATAGSEPDPGKNPDPETPAGDCEVNLAPVDREGIAARVHAMVTGATGSDPRPPHSSTSPGRDASPAMPGRAGADSTDGHDSRPNEIP